MPDIVGAMVWKDSVLSRIVAISDGGAAIESWDDSAWRPGGTDMADFMLGAGVTPALLARLGLNPYGSPKAAGSSATFGSAASPNASENA